MQVHLQLETLEPRFLLSSSGVNQVTPQPSSSGPVSSVGVTPLPPALQGNSSPSWLFGLPGSEARGLEGMKPEDHETLPWPALSRLDGRLWEHWEAVKGSLWNDEVTLPEREYEIEMMNGEGVWMDNPEIIEIDLNISSSI